MEGAGVSCRLELTCQLGDGKCTESSGREVGCGSLLRPLSHTATHLVARNNTRFFPSSPEVSRPEAGSAGPAPSGPARGHGGPISHRFQLLQAAASLGGYPVLHLPASSAASSAPA